MKPKAADVIRDFTQTDVGMKNHWIVGGKNYVLYGVLSPLKVTRGKVSTIRMASPGHSKGIELKEFDIKKLTRPSQTKGIWENK